MESVNLVTPAPVRYRNLLQSIDGGVYLASFISLMYLFGQGSHAVRHFYLWVVVCIIACCITFVRLFKLRGRYGMPTCVGHLAVSASELSGQTQTEEWHFTPQQIYTLELRYTGYAHWQGSWRGDMNYLKIIPSDGEPMEYEIQLRDKAQKERFKSELRAFAQRGPRLKVINLTNFRSQSF